MEHYLGYGRVTRSLDYTLHGNMYICIYVYALSVEGCVGLWVGGGGSE